MNVMNKQHLGSWLVLAAGGLMPLLFACPVRTLVPNQDHCTNNEGDAYCEEVSPDTPRCTIGFDECSLGGRYGCVAEAAEECYQPCGTKSADECEGVSESSSGGSDSSTGESSESGSESSESGTTTGEEPCMGDGDCEDEAAPFCDPVGECVACDAMEEPDTACAGVDAGLPLCVGGACVACSAEDSSVCDGQLLLCDAEANACVGCVAHEECGSGACELAEGRCFPEGMVVHVDGDGGQDFASVSAAVGSVEEGMSGVIVVHETMGLGYAEVTIDAGKTIALLAAPDEAPIIQGTGGSPGVLVQGAGAILYMEGLGLVGNTTGQGLVADEGLAWVDRSRIVQNSGGGVLAQSGAELYLENSVVGRNGDAFSDTRGITATSATLTVLYSTIAANDGTAASGPISMACDPGTSGTVRNSIVAASDDTIACEGITFNDNVVDTSGLTGANNMAMTFDPAWFPGIAMADLHIAPGPPFEDVARWQEGDPVTDIDGDPRPNTDGALDYAGADVP